MTENPVGDPTPGAGSPPPSYGTPAAPQYGAAQQPQYGAPQQPYGAPQYGAPQQGFGGVGPVSQADSRMWAMLAHIGGILFGFVPPLVIWLIYKDRDEFVKDQSVEALNWQITVVIAYAISFVLTFVLIGILTFIITGIAALVLGIMAAIAANRGERYRYPFALRLIK